MGNNPAIAWCLLKRNMTTYTQHTHFPKDKLWSGRGVKILLNGVYAISWLVLLQHP